MANALTLYTSFPTELGLESHQLNTDTLKVALTNATPSAAHTVFDAVTNHAAPTAANGYTAGGHDIQNLYSAGAMTGTNVTITATAGGIGPFRYVILYNDTNATDMLIGYYDYGSALTLSNADDTFTIDVETGTNILTIASA